MLEDFIVVQDHTPNGIASMYFGGVIYRNYANVKDGMSYEDLLKEIYEGYRSDWYYTNPITMKMMAAQARQFGMYFIVNNCTHWFKPDISYELFGRASGAIADKLIDEGYNKNTAAIALFNEPGKSQYCGHGIEGAKKYVRYCQAANHYVLGRFPLILVNDEYHNIDEQYIFDNTKNILLRIYGVHHLSSLGNPPQWQNIIDAKTQANIWKVPIICTEGGSWFKNYQKSEGHAINIKLLEECEKNDYDGCAVVLVDNNKYGKAKKYPKLGYRVWENNYSKIISQTNWDKFEDELKKYKKEEPMPDRDLRVIPGYMHGEDVKKVQTKLRELGFDLKIDSWYGQITERAVKKFQELMSLTQNGIVDKNVREMLEASSVETFYPEVFQNIYESKNYSIEAIDYYLDTFGHPDLKGLGKYFVQAEQETGIPAEWQLANGAAESSYNGGGIGSSLIAQRYNNLFGLGIPDGGPTAEGNFGSFKECILYVPKKIKQLFLDPDNWRYNGDHIFGIEVRYSTACYNSVNKYVQYRKICKFLDAGIKIKVPEFMEELIPLLEGHFVKK